jgi:Ca2+-binding RTX toxin-like protein
VTAVGTDYTLGPNIEKLELAYNFFDDPTSGYAGTGNAMANLIVGTPLFDALDGAAGNDTIYGGTGNDRLYGQGGGDVLTGRTGADLLYGEGGNDRFVYEALDDSPAAEAARDKIIGFGNVGISRGDVIDLSSIDANATRAGNQAFDFKGPAALSGAGQLAVSASGADTLIQGEVDGSRNRL